MNKFNLSKLFGSFWKATKKHSPEILTGIGIAGMFTAGIMAVKATPKALSLMEDEISYRINEDGNIEGLVKVSDDPYGDNFGHYRLPAKDAIVVAWKCYIPAIVISGLSTACLIGASSVNLRRNAALATAYALSETALRDYQEKVVEVIGDKKERTVRDKVAKERVDKNPPVEQEVIITEQGNTLMYDAISGRYFKGDIEKLRKIENVLNRRLRNEDYISLNEFYDEIGLPHIKVGEGLGWCIDKGMIEFDFSAQLTSDDKPCIVIDYRLAPEYGYKS